MDLPVRRGKWITYEEVNDDTKTYTTTKRSLELDWQQEHLKEGRVYFDIWDLSIKKFRRLLNKLLPKSLKKQTLQTKVNCSPSPKFR